MIFRRGTPGDIFDAPLVPYTRDLLRSIPKIDGERQHRLEAIPGAPPDLAAMRSGCAFAPRCRHSDEVCVRSRPELTADGPAGTHLFACWHPIPVASGEESGGERR